MYVGTEYRLSMHGKTEGDVAARLTRMSERLDEYEKRIDCLQNTLGAIAREAGNISVRGRCGSCEQSLMLLDDGMLYCPKCGNGRPL